MEPDGDKWSALEKRFAESYADKRKVKRAEGKDREAEDWSDDPTVVAINSYDGSATFWQPVQKLTNQYAKLHPDMVDERRATLVALSKAIGAWRANQETNWYQSALDKKKADALDILERMMLREGREMTTPAAVPKPTPVYGVTQAMTIGSGGKTGKGGKGKAPSEGGSASLLEGLADTPATDQIGLLRNVQQDEVTPLPDQRKCLVQVGGDGTLRTYDGAFLIDTEGTSTRYVLIADTDVLLYASQEITKADWDTLKGGEGILKYPTLDSHAQIDGNVIGAGDFTVSKGRVVSISNKSGTWQPGGANLAKTLKLLVRMRVMDENEIVVGAVTVQQYVHRPEGYDVDQGDLVKLTGRIMQGKLWK